ncbi:putative MFS-type transporter C409,08 [Rhizoctonia solani AG-1 IB]|uniref:Putative MFS-type transporter C409,08 n=1 Tax=Thanatephorus cucumeris (strain AG1-IB / isolate 7/3/14) TaxID=1108050 RepID=M5BZ37_THACB|nr:putative MFS-type transporter C409,08 [Rhizoctonia solani AG-1 IB]
MAESTDRNSRSDVESTAPTIVDDTRSKNDPGDVDQVIAPGEESAKQITDEKADSFLVQWDGPNDPANPKNWSRPFRWYITALGGVAVLNATFASSAPSGIEGQLIREFNLSTIVAILTISLFVVGYCIGPLMWGPLSENYGRRPIFLIGFLGGTFAACPLTNSGAIIADIWDADTRGKALAIFTLAPFAGPALGPTVAGYMSVAGVSWRWLFGVLSIFAGVCTIVLALTLPETYAPIILKKRAEKLRKSTGDDRYYSAIERENLHWAKRIENILGRPFIMFFQEPMLFAVTLYMSFIYGCVYLLFAACPIVFTQGHHLNAGASGLMFLPLFGGGIAGVVVYLVYYNPIYTKYIKEFAPRPVPPEYRLDMALLAGPLYAASFFWFGWTSYPSRSYFVPAFSGALSGFTIVLLFLSLFNYIIDAYLMYAASALAISTVVRSAFGAGFPLFATSMYEKLNPRIASTVLGAIAAAMIPIPFVLKKYGAQVRRKSKYAPS